MKKEKTSTTKTTITLRDLPKVSLNELHGRGHWTKRQRLKNAYGFMVKSQCKLKFPKTSMYEVEYLFYFEKQPLDASNACGGMVKLIEDVLFESDKWDVVIDLRTRCRKDQDERVEISVTEIRA
jgi:hypothetical protein